MYIKNESIEFLTIIELIIGGVYCIALSRFVYIVIIPLRNPSSFFCHNSHEIIFSIQINAK